MLTHRWINFTLIIFTSSSLFTHTNSSDGHNWKNSNNLDHFSSFNEIKMKNLTYWCSCSNDLIDAIGESECHCEGQKLTQIPKNLQNVTRLSIANADLQVLREIGLKRYSTTLRDVVLINLKKFYYLEPYVFRNVINLRTIYISHLPNLQYIAAEVFFHSSKSFKTLRIIYSGLKYIPNMKYLGNQGILSQVDFEGNLITEILENSVRVKTEQLNLDNNLIGVIHRAAFNGSEIGKLSLKGNKILTNLHTDAFEGIINIRELDLSSTSIHSLSTKGLDQLEILRIQNTPTLKHIPSVYNFKSLEKAYLTHSFHCCAFKFPWRHDPISHKQHMEFLEGLKYECRANQNVSMRLGRSTNVSSFFDENLNFYDNDEISPDNDIDREGIFLSSPVQIVNSYDAMCGKYNFVNRVVKCLPKSDALNPCEDVMGKMAWLRISVWIVVTLAVVGNSAVLIVLLSKRLHFTVPEFLMCNLAFADLSMGIYLLMIASIDLNSMNEYFNYAFDWQYGIGCKTAGFLTVFAVHLSIFTLTIITIERWFAITRAVFLNKRIKYRTAVIIMICGWIYSIIMAALPLFGISNYSSTSICLPMEAKDPADVIYLITLMTLNGIGFFIIVICYVQIYLSLNNQELRLRYMSNREMVVAKKMALLVFTNFVCWAPITFFAVFALTGHSLIDVRKAKILLVFFYPLNSCANPYLYAILTKQYRRDAIMLLSKFGLFTQRARDFKSYYRNPTNSIALNTMNGSQSSSKLGEKRKWIFKKL